MNYTLFYKFSNRQAMLFGNSNFSMLVLSFIKNHSNSAYSLLAADCVPGTVLSKLFRLSFKFNLHHTSAKEILTLFCS